MTEEEFNKVNEQWHAQYDTEKNEAIANKVEFKEANLTLFISTLAMQAMIALGRLDNPNGIDVGVNLEQARFMIDTITVIAEKTTNNLNEEEEKFLTDTIYHLRTNYLEVAKNQA